MSLRCFGIAMPCGGDIVSARTLSSAAACVVVLLTPLCAQAGTYTGSNATPILINPDTNTTDNISATNVYPSAITFTGIPSNERIVSMILTLNGFTALDTNGIMAAVALQGSTQSVNALLFDGPGSINNTATNLTLNFDASSTNKLPTSGSFSSGTYAPDFDNTGYRDILPAGNVASPAANVTAPQETSDAYPTSFNAFTGANPNGTFLLFVNNFYTGATENASLTQGWSLTINTAALPEPTSSSLISFGLIGCAATFGRRRCQRQQLQQRLQGE